MSNLASFFLRFGFLVMPILGIAAAHGADRTRSSEGEFAVRFDSTLDSCAGRKKGICVVGSIAQGKTPFLLSSTESKICHARIAETFMAGWEVGEDFPLTRIDRSNCPNFDFRLVVFHPRTPTYRVLADLSGAPDKIARLVDAAVRAGISRILPQGTEHPSELSPRSPKVFRLASQSPNSYIAVYENARIPGDQTHVLFSNGELKLIHSAANIRSIFTLGKRHFIHYEFSCKIGCGWGGDIVVEFAGANFKVVMFEDAGST